MSENNGVERKSFDIKVKAEVVAWALTMIYLLGVIIFCISSEKSLFDLSFADFGGFLSSAVGPLAFLWLVLGYYQQGRELKLSSQELANQSHELKMSVDQQMAMVKLTEQALMEQMKQSAFDRSVRESEAEPLLQVEYLDQVMDGADNASRFTLRNHSSRCSDLRFYMKRGDDEEPVWKAIASLPQGMDEQVVIPGRYLGKFAVYLVVKYRKSTGSSSEQIFQICYVMGGIPLYKTERMYV